jgi:hypothetical protein
VLQDRARFGHVPLMFEWSGANDGGTDRFVSRGPGYNLGVSSDEVIVTLRPDPVVSPDRRRVVPVQCEGQRSSTRVTGGTLRMRLLGARAQARATPEEALSTRIHYLRGSNPANWRTNVPVFGRVRYQDVYPGIDAVYYGNQRQLEYDFVVAPNADPGRIRVGFDGADLIELGESGDLVLNLGGAEVRFRRPTLYQETDDGRREVSGFYRIDHGAAGPVVGFDVGSYDRERTLVIDPILVYATYLGGLGYEQGSGVAVDAQGHAYVTGETASMNFPVVDALWPTNNGGFAGSSNPLGNEAFIVKFGPAGTNLVYATYLGGNGVDAGIGIAIDDDGHAYVTGLTTSTNFPVTPNAFETNLTGTATFGFYPSDAFLVKLSPTGDALLYSTYMGGANPDQGLGIALDNQGSVYVTGSTTSGDFPVVEGSPTFGGNSDVFVAKFNSAGGLVYSRFLGGAGFEFGQGIAVDGQGHAVVTGQTGSAGFPVIHAAQNQFRGGTYDAFVTRFSPDGATLIYSTFLGGSGTDEALGIALDSSGNAHVTGYTLSIDFPVTNALYATKAPRRDAFLTRLNPAGNLLYSTFLGGNGDDEGWAVAVNDLGAATVVGSVRSSNFPVINAVQSSLGGNSDVFITRFNPAGDALEFSTYLGGGNNDAARGLALDELGAVYVTGFTQSINFPVIPGTNAFQSTFGGGTGDAFVVKVSLEDAALAVAAAPAGGVTVSWPEALGHFVLESNSSVVDTNGWMGLESVPVPVGDRRVVTITNLTGTAFFRLRQVE